MNRTRVDEIAKKHADRNAKFLSEFFYHFLITRSISLTANEAVQKVLESMKKIKDSCRSANLSQLGQRTFRIQSRKPALSPSAVRVEEAADDLETSQYFDAEQSKTITPQKSSQQTATISPQTPQRTPPPVPRNPQTPSPRTPPRESRPNESAPSAPLRTAGRRITHQTVPRTLFNRNTPPSDERRVTGTHVVNTPVARPNAVINRERPRTLPPNLTPQRPSIHTSTPNRPANPDMSFRVIMPSPDASAIRSIECDRNLTDREIGQVNQIIENISGAAGDEIFASGAVALSTRGVRLSPGKYKLYKVMRF